MVATTSLTRSLLSAISKKTAKGVNFINTLKKVAYMNKGIVLTALLILESERAMFVDPRVCFVKM